MLSLNRFLNLAFFLDVACRVSAAFFNVYYHLNPVSSSTDVFISQALHTIEFLLKMGASLAVGRCLTVSYLQTHFNTLTRIDGGHFYEERTGEDDVQLDDHGRCGGSNDDCACDAEDEEDGSGGAGGGSEGGDTIFWSTEQRQRMAQYASGLIVRAKFYFYLTILFGSRANIL